MCATLLCLLSIDEAGTFHTTAHCRQCYLGTGGPGYIRKQVEQAMGSKPGSISSCLQDPALLKFLPQLFLSDEVGCGSCKWE